MTSEMNSSQLQCYLSEAKIKLGEKDNVYFDGCLAIKKKNKRSRAAIEKYNESIDEGDESIKFLYLALQYAGDSISESYKSNIFKPSAFEFQYPPQTYNHLCALHSMGVFPEGVQQYIESVLNIIRFSPVVLPVYSHVKQVVETDGMSFLKSVLAYVDLFVLKQIPWEFSDGQLLSKEEIAESCSYIASIFFDNAGSLSRSNCDISVSKLEEYFNAILLSHILKQYIYAEMMIGKLPYTAQIKERSLVISPMDSGYEKCRVCGYVNHGLQSQKVHSAITEHLDTNNDFLNCLDSHKEELSDLLVIKTNAGGPERLVLGLIDDETLIETFSDFFNQNSIFTDEASLIAYTCSQFHINAKDLYKFTINDQITVLDLIKIRRFFVFIGKIFGHALLKEYTDRSFPPPSIVMRSILPAFEKERMHQLLGLFFDESVVESFISILSFNPQKDTFFDIQYKPITDMGEFYYCNVQALISSDLIRNSLVYHKQRFFEDNLNEPLVVSLYNALKEHNPLTKSNYFVGSQEVDCISVFDNSLFLFEVKNNFLPCNYAEERTTYDHIEKSSKQLSRAVDELSKSAIQARVESDFGVTNIAHKKIYTCTILGNRVFTGHKINGHSVRYSGEVTNFLETGIGVKDGKKYRMWEGDTFGEADLIWFVESGGTNVNLATLCDSRSDTYNFGDFSISFPTFTLPAEKIYSQAFLKALEEAGEECLL